jgi:hypothetical protein
VISAPAALLIAKVMQPEVEEPKTLGSVQVLVPRTSANLVEAASIGAADGLKLALNVGAMLIAFLALLAMADAAVGAMGRGTGHILGYGDWQEWDWSLTAGFGYAFAPVAWLMGIEARDCLAAGRLLGEKMVANEFVAYVHLSEWRAPDSAVQLSRRSVVILTYALCGFANFSSIGIQLGGIGGIAPERRTDLAKLGIRAMLGGTLAAFMTACVAGIIIELPESPEPSRPQANGATWDEGLQVQPATSDVASAGLTREAISGLGAGASSPMRMAWLRAGSSCWPASPRAKTRSRGCPVSTDWPRRTSISNPTEWSIESLINRLPPPRVTAADPSCCVSIRVTRPGRDATITVAGATTRAASGSPP